MGYVITGKDNQYRTIVNTKTGVIRKIKLASDKQLEFLESLRRAAGKETPLKERPAAYTASKSINNYLKKTNQQTLL